MTTESLIATLGSIVGPQYVLTDSADTASYLTDWRGRYRGAAQCVVRPGNAVEVAAVVKTCIDAGIPIVPQGGNTSLCGAATPDGEGLAVVISLSRMNRVRSIDPENNTITAEAGCVLASLQYAAVEAGRLFPLSLAAEGSAQAAGIARRARNRP